MFQCTPFIVLFNLLLIGFKLYFYYLSEIGLCRFESNEASSLSGGLHATFLLYRFEEEYHQLLVRNSIFNNNDATFGGGVYFLVLGKKWVWQWSSLSGIAQAGPTYLYYNAKWKSSLYLWLSSLLTNISLPLYSIRPQQVNHLFSSISPLCYFSTTPTIYIFIKNIFFTYIATV